MTDIEHAYVADAAAALNDPTPAPSRELWQPDPEEQRLAVETLLSSPIPREVRVHLRDFHAQLCSRRAA